MDEGTRAIGDAANAILTVMDVRPARDDDAAVILQMRHAAEDWLAEKGIDQWRPREVPLATVREQIDRGEFVVARFPSSGVVAAAMRLMWSDPEIWRHDDAFAGYVHGLVIDRAHAGQNLGRHLLDWAAQETRMAGASKLRLDCAETNLALRDYYRRCGFREFGRRDLDGFSVTLFERTLT
ncbi:GNAT family N-acetyltransferase [Rhodococcus coprophilus]|uniref:Acetyltransferase (GNAT) family n=1 Tax=Rhodococcus coprophilus TaxID=38310 RepID=A0A2X4U079_9NOCA|nr:GNAT family N-acetyltransferase [Rhodococcus coprophilus]MBM7460610.1 ribosomal protein S18 acetylase RimI-like enzyme [Rhodococcus coprophilus]SQI28418.1 Acetyltransferase (GNAT) family [Rhodococcus coprophilus]